MVLTCIDRGVSYKIIARNGFVGVEECSEDAPADFHFAAPYSTWVSIAKGEVRIQCWVVGGPVKFRGSMPKMHSISQNSEGRRGLAYLVSLAGIAGMCKFERIVDGFAAIKPASYECMSEMALAVGKGDKHIGFPAILACISYYIDLQNRTVALSMSSDIPYLTTFSPTLGLVAGGENTETAEMAFDFALSKDWQERVGAFSCNIPARPGIDSAVRLPECFMIFPTRDDVANHEVYLKPVQGRLRFWP